VELPLSVAGEILVEVEDRVGNLARATLPMSLAGGGLGEAVAYPNPARRRVTIRYQLAADAARARVRVMDMAGRTVRVLTAPTSAGSQQVVWNLEDRRGRRVSNGVYVAELSVQPASGSALRRRLKVAVLR
jgi:hypothetical protein